MLLKLSSLHRSQRKRSDNRIALKIRGENDCPISVAPSKESLKHLLDLPVSEILCLRRVNQIAKNLKLILPGDRQRHRLVSQRRQELIYLADLPSLTYSGKNLFSTAELLETT